MEENKRSSNPLWAYPQLLSRYASLASTRGWKSICSLKQIAKLCGLLISTQLFQDHANSGYAKRKSNSLSQKLHGCTLRIKTYRSNKHGLVLCISRCVPDVGLSISTCPAKERVSNVEWLPKRTWLYWHIWTFLNIFPSTHLISLQGGRTTWFLSRLRCVHICYRFLGSSFTSCDWHSSQHLPLFAKLTKQKIARTTYIRAITTNFKLDGCLRKGRTRLRRRRIWWRWWGWVWYASSLIKFVA